LYHHLIDNTTPAQTKARECNQLEVLEIFGIALRKNFNEILSGVNLNGMCGLFRGKGSIYVFI
jgi:hypothetical protein